MFKSWREPKLDFFCFDSQIAFSCELELTFALNLFASSIQFSKSFPAFFFFRREVRFYTSQKSQSIFFFFFFVRFACLQILLLKRNLRVCLSAFSPRSTRKPCITPFVRKGQSFCVIEFNFFQFLLPSSPEDSRKPMMFMDLRDFVAKLPTLVKFA